jgi:hypothetical protein
MMIGIFNLLIDREILISLGEIGLSGGWVSFVSVLIRFALTVGVALSLIAVTGFNAVCMALDKLGTPRVFHADLQCSRLDGQRHRGVYQWLSSADSGDFKDWRLSIGKEKFKSSSADGRHGFSRRG